MQCTTASTVWVIRYDKHGLPCHGAVFVRPYDADILAAAMQFLPNTFDWEA